MSRGQGTAAVPGAAEARAALEAARAREADLAVRIQGSEQARRASVKARADLVAKIAGGGDAPAPAAAEATAAIAAAEQDTALLQDALRGAEEATKRAEGRLSAVLSAELRRRYPEAKARSAAAQERHFAALEEWNAMDVLAAELLRAAGGIGDLDYLLELSAELAAPAGEAAAEAA